MSTFIPKNHKDWVRPHSLEWYAQLGQLTGQYTFSWQSTITGWNGELIFAKEVSQMVPGKTVLDIGCGHGEFTLQWSPVVRRIVGIDVTSDFVKRGNAAGQSNVSFVTANTKQGLPFADEAFDCAYNRRGPTSAYLDVKRIIRKGGRLIGLHPGDRITLELAELFPELFEPAPAGTPVLDNIEQRLEQGGLLSAEIETVRGVEYLHEPIDVLRMSLLGQKPTVFDMAMQESLPAITRIFEQHATDQGLPTTFERYIVRAMM